MTYRFASVEEVTERLQATGYLADPMIANVIWLADRLQKPVLAEGPAGTGCRKSAPTVSRSRPAVRSDSSRSRALGRWERFPSRPRPIRRCERAR